MLLIGLPILLKRNAAYSNKGFHDRLCKQPLHLGRLRHPNPLHPAEVFFCGRLKRAQDGISVFEKSDTLEFNGDFKIEKDELWFAL